VPSQLRVVSEGDAGLAFLQRQVPYHEAPTPDLILLDIQLPKKTGWEILRWVRATPAFAHIPVVMLAGMFSPLDEQARAHLQPTRCLKKPTTLEELHDLRTIFEELMSQTTSSDCSL
jgi:two-component system, chemotaxis family, response regulator Rcp1